MTKAQQRTAIHKMLKKYTRQSTQSRKKATDALIAEGIYTKKGKLKKQYGGAGSDADTATA